MLFAVPQIPGLYWFNNAWDCTQTYSGSAVAFGCDDSSPGNFQITADGTYYLLFRTGGGTFGDNGIVLD
ncbi:hypothetical protein OAU54_02385, partial [Flavobacteriaceae bacterium]|nr:hypothetical protein [Flavobacteriaceae bacterium]